MLSLAGPAARSGHYKSAGRRRCSRLRTGSKSSAWPSTRSAFPTTALIFRGGATATGNKSVLWKSVILSASVAAGYQGGRSDQIILASAERSQPMKSKLKHEDTLEKAAAGITRVA